MPAKRAAKVMRGYLEQFEKLAKDNAAEGLGGPELALLNLVGLFDRPADGPAVDALLARHIPGLTDDLFFERLDPAGCSSRTRSSWSPFPKSPSAASGCARPRAACANC